MHVAFLSRGVGVAGLVAALALPVGAAPAWGRAADNRIYAQRLVNDLMASEPGLLSVALHATRPGKKLPEIVAHTQDLIGKEDSPEDAAIIAQDQSVIGPEMVEHTAERISRMVVHAPLRDRAGMIIGLAVFSFRRTAGQEKIAALTRAEAMLQALGQKIPDAAALFAPSS